MKFLLAVLASSLALSLGGCTSAEDRNASECRQHDFVMGTPEYNKCMNLLEDQ